MKYHWKPMKDVVAWIETQLTEPLRLSDVADYAGYSEFHLSRVFREHTGLPVIAYIRERSMILAAHDLNGKTSIGNIALCHGYESSSAFSRAFRKTFECTPSEYRMLLQTVTDMEDVDMLKIKTISDNAALRVAYDLADYVLNLSSLGQLPYTLDFFNNELSNRSELLLYGEIDKRIVGVAFGRVNPDNNVTLALLAVDESYRKCGYGTALMDEFILTARAGGHRGIYLGSNEGADDFFIKCGFTPTLFLQSQKHSLDELRALNTSYRELWGLESDENGWCRLMLETPTIDEKLTAQYDVEFEDCLPQTVFQMLL